MHPYHLLKIEKISSLVIRSASIRIRDKYDTADILPYLLRNLKALMNLAFGLYDVHVLILLLSK